MTTFADLRLPKTVAQNKLTLYGRLMSPSDPATPAFTQAASWESGSVPSALVEIEAEAITDYQEAQRIVAESKYIDTAEGDALSEHARQVYGIARSEGAYTVGYITLTDAASVGPTTFSQGSVSFSVGQGGLTFDGVSDGTMLTLPRAGTVAVKVKSRAIGSQYVVAAGTVNFFSRGILPGVTCTNLSTWLTDGTALPQGGSQSGCVQGSSPTTDANLREEAKAQWGTLGTGSPESAYVKWARAADPSITRVKVYTNLDLLDPGRVDVIIAGDGGGLGAGPIAAAQAAISPLTVGGDRIPETAKAVVSTASNVVIVVGGTVYVKAGYNTAAFQAKVAADLLAYQKDLDIGGLVSWERLLAIVQRQAGTSARIVTNVSDFVPVVDLQLNFDQVAVFTDSLTYVSV